MQVRRIKCSHWKKGQKKIFFVSLQTKQTDHLGAFLIHLEQFVSFIFECNNNNVCTPIS